MEEYTSEGCKLHVFSSKKIRSVVNNKLYAMVWSLQKLSVWSQDNPANMKGINIQQQYLVLIALTIKLCKFGGCLSLRFLLYSNHIHKERISMLWVLYHILESYYVQTQKETTFTLTWANTSLRRKIYIWLP